MRNELANLFPHKGTFKRFVNLSLAKGHGCRAASEVCLLPEQWSARYFFSNNRSIVKRSSYHPFFNQRMPSGDTGRQSPLLCCRARTKHGRYGKRCMCADTKCNRKQKQQQKRLWQIQKNVNRGWRLCVCVLGDELNLVARFTHL